MTFMQKNIKGLLLCMLIAVPCWFLGNLFPLIGGPVFAILLGMLLTLFISDKNSVQSGINFVSKKILQYAVILLGFGLNLSVVLETGRQSLPIIISTIGTSLILAYFLSKALKIPTKTATLVGVGSSICGGSAIAATAPVISANDEEVAQSISVIFFFNMLAALCFPALGVFLGIDSSTGEAFGVFAGTAVNDTSSVTATAATWDSMYKLGSETLDKAVIVKLTRTLAIIPITMFLAFLFTSKNSSDNTTFSLKSVFPFFIIYFILASIITTVTVNMGINPEVFAPIKYLSHFFIILAMSAIGLNTNIIKLIKTGGKPLALGFCCWTGITIVSLIMQYFLGIW